MGELLGNMLPLAVGMAISPVPIIAVILMLSSKKAIKNAVLFDVGWVLAIVAASVVVLLVFGSSSISGQKTTGTVTDILHLVLGVLLLALGVRKFIQKRKGAVEKQPKLLASIDSIKPWSAFVFGLAMVIVNPKNLMMLLAALGQVVQAGESTATNAISLTIFMLVASAGVLIPLLVYAVAREKAAEMLTSWKDWLMAHDSTVMMYLLTVLGIFLIVKGIVGLAG